MAVPLLPTLLGVTLDNFTLYSRRPDATVVFDKDVFCLAGANGLGKSTFLSLITYGLTGRVPEPDRSFQSIQDYVRESRDFTRDYFRGRIDSVDLEIASVCVLFRLGSHEIEVTRGFERPEDVLNVRQRSAVGDDDEWRNLSSNSGQSLDSLYENLFCEISGLRDFAQFVFLQHFVLTFDERRHLIFWEPKLTEPALFLGFGGDSELAARAGALRSAMDKQGSRARNSRWQATATRARISSLMSASTDTKNDFEDAGSDRLTRVRNAQLKKDSRETRLANLQREVLDGHVTFGQISSTLAGVSRRLEREIADSGGRRDPWHHSMIVQMTMSGHCVACGSGDSITAHLNAAREAQICPICGVRLESSGVPLPTSVLELDAELSGLRTALKESEKNLVRLQYEVVSAKEDLNQSIILLEEFDLEDRVAAQRLNAPSETSMELALTAMESEFAALTREADEFIEARDALRVQLTPLLDAVTDAYREAEQHFVPLFRELAEDFIGLPLDVELIAGSGPLSLSLTVDGTKRTKTSQLSESQRFFLDIALRMALVEYMSSERNSDATIYVDTPEGSLDIAYESRAGELFAAYAKEGRQLVMTSNINSSRLLLQLANICGVERLQLEPMTDWSTMSQVQIEESELFESALLAIRTAQGIRE